MQDEYIDTYKAAEELRISRALLWKLLKARGITRYKMPGERRTLVRRRDLEGLRQPVPIAERGPTTKGKRGTEGKAAA